MKPLVLCFGGHDPSGGAGIQADIESICANKAQAMSIITAITTQNTKQVTEIIPINSQLIYRQTMCLLDEFKPDVIKLGMTACSETIQIIAKIKQQLPNTPLIIDPVLYSGNGEKLFTNDLKSAFELLWENTLLITPNVSEMTILGGAEQLLCAGIQNILLTTTDVNLGDNIEHILYDANTSQSFTYSRLPYKYHGSGCTLASSISAHIAHKESIAVAVKNGLDYTFQVLKHTHSTDSYQLIPNREI